MFSSAFISEFLTKFSWLGGWVFLFLAFLESIPLIGLVIPGATIISIGGFLASQGYLNVWYVAFSAVSGAIIGDLLNYCLGKNNSSLIKNKKIVSQTLLNKGEKFFKEYGGVSLFLGRFLGPLKQVIPFIAGILPMKLKSFIFWDSAGILSWALGYTFFGYFSGTVIGSLLKNL